MLAIHAVYCNENNGRCGDTKAHHDASDGDAFDYRTKSCEKTGDTN